ncbi:MAG TPA: thioredoxin domain-containing protein [Anaeromyxobacter sp.]|nr:thioredoxin domain-containing protein [Anaeromyxobacter sp.]
MKQVSWMVALVLGFALGYVANGATSGGGFRTARAAAPIPAGARMRPPAPPPAAYAKVPLRADDPVRGPQDAKLTVVLFSDFQCPFCARVEPSLKQLEEAFPGQLRIVWKHQPLPMHPNAMPAALAAEAARLQGKFWPMHDRMFENQQGLSDDAYRRWALDLGLDPAKFQAALAGRAGADRIAEDQTLASSVGANGTPTMFFNCRKVVGAQPFESLKAVAEDELKKADGVLQGQRPGPDAYDRLCQVNLALAPPAPAAAAPAAPPPPSILPASALPLRADDPVRGNPKAPVTIVLFSDFQCPFCARVEPTLAELQKSYGDKVRIVWKHQPLPFHPNALPAAEAAEAAREQGKFWEMHDRMFQNQQELSDEAYRRWAKELGLDLRRFDEARQSPRLRARVEEDQKLGSSVGANGTPTLFVNGEMVVGAQPADAFKQVIDRKLAR